MIGGKLYDFDAGVSNPGNVWASATQNIQQGVNALLAQQLQKKQQEAYQQGLLELSKNQYGLQPMDEEGLAAMIASNPDLNQEDIEVITAMQGPQSDQGLAGMSAPQRRQFAITPEMQQRAVAIDYLTGSQPGTALNQLMGQYKDLVASADEKAIGDFERERAYQDTRADKAKAEERAERAYQDAKAKEQRDIEKQRMEYVDKRLESLQGPAFRAATETAKTNVANEARNLDPERFAGKSDEEILERLKLGVEPSKTSGLTFEQQIEKMREEYKLKERLEKIKKETKVAQDAAKNEGKMGEAEKKIMQKEADNIGKEVDKLQEENRKVQKFNASYVKNIKKIDKFDKDLEDLDDLVARAEDFIGVGIRTRGKNNPDAVDAYQKIKSLITELNTSMVEFVREAGATGKMLDTDEEKKLFLGPMAELAKNIGGLTTTENDVKSTIRMAVDAYKGKMRGYENLLSEMNKNYNDNENRLNNMKSNFDTKYGLNKNKPVKSGTTKTAAGFKITIK